MLWESGNPSGVLLDGGMKGEGALSDGGAAMALGLGLGAGWGVWLFGLRLQTVSVICCF